MAEEIEGSGPFGYIDHVDANKIRGWARTSDGPAELRVIENGLIIGSAETKTWRADLNDHCGYEIEIDTDEFVTKLLCGMIGVFVVTPLGDFQLGMTRECRGWLIAHRFANDIPDVGLDGLRTVVEQIQAYTVSDDRDYQIYKIIDGAEPAEMTSLTVPVGLLSADGEAVVGRDGHVFLARGSNNLLHQYGERTPYSASQDRASRWFEVFSNRSAELARRSVDYVQCIVPEKSSVLHDLFPVRIPDKTDVLRILEAMIFADASLSRHYLNAHALLADARLRREAYQQIDTHISAKGAFRLTEAIVGRCGLHPLPPVGFDARSSAGGDVGRRILSPYARSTMPAPSGEGIERLGEGVRRVAAHFASTMTGSRFSYENPLAPNDLRIVAFGTSALGIGDEPSQISWWLSRICREYHFFWSTRLDLSLVDSLKPDIVICHSSERFLTRVVDA